ncbi:hypothetical protein HQ545_03105 [Candidatus Woesearchaeota archaeon]|nr:hypothetical protein [Candidatus Woesearchaeota archaeon]
MQYKNGSVGEIGRIPYGWNDEPYAIRTIGSTETYIAREIINQAEEPIVIGIDALFLMPDKDGTGPRGKGKQDGSGSGKGNQGKGRGGNKGGKGQGPKTGGEKGGCKS